MHKLTRLTAASVATLTLTAGSFAAFAAAHHAKAGSDSRSLTWWPS